MDADADAVSGTPADWRHPASPTKQAEEPMSAIINCKDPDTALAANAGTGDGSGSGDPQPTAQSEAPGGLILRAAGLDDVARTVAERTGADLPILLPSANAPVALDSTLTTDKLEPTVADSHGQQDDQTGVGIEDVLPPGRQVMLVLVGLVASGKSTFAQALERHFPQFRRCSQDELGDRRSVEALARQTLGEGLSVVIDRTNFDESQRATWIRIGREVPGTLVWVMVFDTPYEVSPLSLHARVRRTLPNVAIEGTGHPTITTPELGLEVLENFQSLFRPPVPHEGYSRILYLKPADLPPTPELSAEDVQGILRCLQATPEIVQNNPPVQDQTAVAIGEAINLVVVSLHEASQCTEETGHRVEDIGMGIAVKEIPTKPFDGQKPGTSGLRKRVKVFEQEHYTENFIQAIFDSVEPSGKTIVIGGDGRYFSPETVQTILKIGSANGVAKFIIGQNAILSTPAASNVIRKYKADGGILLTASHNPGGPNADFGIKYNMSNGGPAPESVTNTIYEKTKTISTYRVIELAPIDLSKKGFFTYGPTNVEIIDSVSDYVRLLESIFDFPLIKNFLQSHANDFKVLFDGMHGVTGPYGRAILVDALGLPASSVQNAIPLPDFGGGHPDPNLTYAHDLVERVEKEGIQFGAASDGDGDRNMIYGKGAFVTPSDSVAIIADWAAEAIPYFKKGGVKGLARSMPTSAQIDYVAKKKGLECHVVPTGWKFFGNLMDAGRLSICGEESFGTGSDHIREKDGVWAVVAWLNILAYANQQTPNELVGIKELLSKHYAVYGRSFFSRYDYEEVSSEGAQKLVDALNAHIAAGSLAQTTHKSQSTGQEFAVAGAANFDYTDPIDGSVSRNQGQVVSFADGSRVVFRLSGTGSQGATVRMYVERYVGADKGAGELGKETQEGLKGLIEVALEISRLREFLGREKPTVIT
ncbi:hypothetical protein GSI_11008 [Ganoderma sinense ZZ0214-1]|uniref:phosphoglucomutase (alpha-D-glucose-1,6-bisphosphate-dependent) n=1 Tax=Ganoderma sinense ZZ0214-1 TaxID=1077348 RepID=A0A2G8S283_9APHY|nr:hypothetical protein GSI_11008 [Ganoderma sinense ZZ0214-1]